MEAPAALLNVLCPTRTYLILDLSLTNAKKYRTYVLSMDEVDLSQEGIVHKNIIDFLLDDEI